MAVRKLKPTTPGQRFKIISAFNEISSNRNCPEKKLLKKQHRSGGRNHSGKMTMRYMGGGHKKRYRVIDFKRDKIGVPGIVHSIEYDPNRSARIALIYYKDGEKRYIISPNGLQEGQEIISGKDAPPEPGNAMPLQHIPLGTVIHNIEMQPGQGGKIARSAGSYAQLAARDKKYAVLRMPSGETRQVLITCMATIGSVSNADHQLLKSGKAGRSRWLGRRPRTRGVVMNPVDHPMGGGEGRASGGHPRSRKGLPAKGYKTRNKKKHSQRLILERRKK